LDGIFNDGMGYTPDEFGPACNATGCWPKVNRARNDAAFAGKMLLGDEARTLYGNPNGGEVWGNAALGVTARYSNFTYKDQLVSWQTVMDHVDTGFLEGALGMWYMNTTTGEWLPDELEIWMENIINASTAGKSVVLHFNPGPSFPPFTNYPINGTPGNQFIAPTWVGPEKLPTTAAGIRQAAADALVTSLAPFLIVANEHVFLQYAWFYEVQDGNIPCPSYIECGMPETWYPEFSKPLGPPTGPAAHNGYIWTREFAHASVYVDVRTRHSSKITWH